MLIEEVNAKMYEGWESVKKEIKEIENNLNRIGIDLRPCHNDAVPENFIKTKDGVIYLIDWEYSGINDPTADIAALFLESSFSNSSQEAFLNLYYNGNVPADIKVKIKYFQILWDCLWAQWTIIKEAKGDNFGTYGKDRFYRAIANIKSLKNN